VGVERISFVKSLCKELNKEVPADEDIPMTSISTDLRAFVSALPEATAKPKSSKKKKVIADASEEKEE
tara:strand:+ start:410 stop:613 length:204 start_codon:yes stop_codon:yes gene_type:complete